MSDVTSVSPILDPEIFSASTYKGFPIFPGIHNKVDPIPDAYPRVGKLVDSETGAKAFKDQTGFPVPRRSVRWFVSSRKDALAMRTFIIGRAGRLNPFWIPTFTWDLQYIASFGTNLIVRGYGYAANLFPQLSRRYLAIFPAGLTAVYFSKVLSVTEDTASVDGSDVTVEELVLDADPGVPMYFGQTRISFLTLCRLASDDATITWFNPNAAETTLELVELPREVPA